MVFRGDLSGESVTGGKAFIFYFLFTLFTATHPRCHGVWARTRVLDISPPAHPLGCSFRSSRPNATTRGPRSSFIVLRTADPRLVVPVRNLARGRSRPTRVLRVGRVMGAAPGLFATLASVYRCVSPLFGSSPLQVPSPSPPFPLVSFRNVQPTDCFDFYQKGRQIFTNHLSTIQTSNHFNLDTIVSKKVVRPKTVSIKIAWVKTRQSVFEKFARI